MAKKPSNIAQYNYGQITEKYLAKGKSVEQAHKIASSPLMRIPDKVDKPSMTDKAVLKGLKLVKKLRRKKK